MSRNPFSKKKIEIYDVENEDQNEDDLRKLEHDEARLAKDQKKVDDLVSQAEVAKLKQDSRKSDLEDQRRRHEEEVARRKAKKDQEALAKSSPTKTGEPTVLGLTEAVIESSIESVVFEPKSPLEGREPVPFPQTAAEPTPSISETTENVVSPVIGSVPSTFFRTPWSRTEKPLHGLSFHGYAGDVHCDAGTYGSIASVGATMRGLKHQVPDRNSGAASQNEDWFSTCCAVSASGAKYVVSVVCDGLSSAQYSWYGARRTSTLLGRDVVAGIASLVEVNSQTLQNIVDNSLTQQASTLMNWSSLEYGAPQVDASEVDPVALGCTVTLTVVCADADANGSHSVVAGNVGDSPVFSLANGAWRKVSPLDPDADSGDILDTKTHAFPRHTECALVDDILHQGECVLMTSDGVGNFIFRNGMTLALGGYLSTRWNEPIGILTFLNQLNFDLTTADDDRTAVAFWPA